MLMIPQFFVIETIRDELQLQSDLYNISLWRLNNVMRMSARKCRFVNIALSKLRRIGRYTVNEILGTHTAC
jgi:hypothetical protein